jgi:hypothetical protein
MRDAHVEEAHGALGEQSWGAGVRGEEEVLGRTRRNVGKKIIGKYN